jgi:pyridoxal phosphate enzyme (YggS family)
MADDSVEHNLARVRAEIERVQTAEGLRGPVGIVAVTKGHGLDAVRAALVAGLRDLGENRVQEAVAKMDDLGPGEARWHLIGHLQTNKAKHVPGRFHLVHSADSLKVVAALAKAVGEPAGAPLGVLVQVNVAGEEQKSGCEPHEAAEIAAAVSESRCLALRGLMTMAPWTEDERIQRRAFGALRRLQEELSAQGLSVPELSMGMSGDYRAAVAEGATLLRLGTVLFGERSHER